MTRTIKNTLTLKQSTYLECTSTPVHDKRFVNVRNSVWVYQTIYL